MTGYKIHLIKRYLAMLSFLCAIFFANPASPKEHYAESSNCGIVESHFTCTKLTKALYNSCNDHDWNDKEAELMYKSLKDKDEKIIVFYELKWRYEYDFSPYSVQTEMRKAVLVNDGNSYKIKSNSRL
jgi:hypothetical protein